MKNIFNRKINQNGLTPVIIIAAVAILLALAGGGYFFLSKNDGMGNPLSVVSENNPLTKAALNPNCKHNDPELCKFLNNMTVKKDFSVKSTSTMGGMKVESMYEMSGEDKFHSVTSINGKEDSNIISIGDTMYTLDYTDKKWWKQTFKDTESKTTEISEMKEKFDFEEKTEEDKTTYKFIAKESCQSLNCHKYEMILPDMTEGKNYIWFDDKEYLMRKMVIETKEGNSESVYDYKTLSITAPSPTKEGNPGVSGTGSNPDVEKMMQEYQKQMEKEENSKMTESPVKANPSFDMESPLDQNSSEEDYF